MALAISVILGAFTAAILGGCASFATPIGTARRPEDAVKIVGFFRYYMLHSSYGQIERVDSEWLAGLYAVKTAPGPHLVDLSFSEVSVMNPLIFGGGRCALILETLPGRTYQLRPPSVGVYYRFWSRPSMPGLIDPKRFATTIEVAVSGRDTPGQELEVPLDCNSGEYYCRVATDCPNPSETRADANQAAAAAECVYSEAYPVGICVTSP